MSADGAEDAAAGARRLPSPSVDALDSSSSRLRADFALGNATTSLEVRRPRLR